MIVRFAIPADANDMAEVLNAIILIGGTTAHETLKSAEEVQHGYIDGPDVLSSVVAEVDGRVVGWQSVELYKDESHIGTFVQPGLQARGAGSRMFALTCERLRQLGVGQIIASIRADNVPGLAYYARIGFRDIRHEPEFALSNGQRVGRIHRCFDL